MRRTWLEQKVPESEKHAPIPPIVMYNCQRCGRPRRTLVVRGTEELCRECADKCGTPSAGQRADELRQVQAMERERARFDQNPDWYEDPYERMVTGRG